MGAGVSVENLQRWSDDGTLARIAEAQDSRTPVKIKRSSGEYQDAVLASACGFGGLLCIAVWREDGEEPTFTHTGERVEFADGVSGKHVDTADLIGWNPWLKGSQR